MATVPRHLPVPEPILRAMREDDIPDVVAAERDSFTPPALARRMADSIPGSEMLELAGASHAAPIEQPEVMRARLTQFIRERVAR